MKFKIVVFTAGIILLLLSLFVSEVVFGLGEEESINKPSITKPAESSDSTDYSL